MPVVTALALPKESLTVTHLRKMYRNCASLRAMQRVAGGVQHFQHLDSRYGITKPRDESDDLLPIGRDFSAAQINGRRKPWESGIKIPPLLDNIDREVCAAFDLKPGTLGEPVYTHGLMQPRAMFVGVARHLMPKLHVTVMAAALHRDVHMVGKYLTNHRQFVGSPEYVERFARVVAVLEGK